eukprot:15462194-Alexandrium_andersonii.AAC.1
MQGNCSELLQEVAAAAAAAAVKHRALYRPSEKSVCDPVVEMCLLSKGPTFVFYPELRTQ